MSPGVRVAVGIASVGSLRGGCDWWRIRECLGNIDWRNLVAFRMVPKYQKVVLDNGTD